MSPAPDGAEILPAEALLPEAAWPELAEIGPRLAQQLRSAEARAVIRDLARERRLHTLSRALRPSAFFPHAVRETLLDLELSAQMLWDWAAWVAHAEGADHLSVTLEAVPTMLPGCGPRRVRELFEQTSAPPLAAIDAALRDLGLQPTGPGTITGLVHSQGWAPRAPHERL